MKLKALFSNPQHRLTALLVVLIIVIASIFFSPLLQGKRIRQYDQKQIDGMGASIDRYNHPEKYSAPAHADSVAYWSPSAFSGLPASAVYAKREGWDVFTYLSKLEEATLGKEISMFVIGMLCTFGLLLTLRVPPLGAFAGAIIFGFFPYYIHITEAGHYTKLNTLMTLPGVIWGMMLLYRQRYLAGALVSLIFIPLAVRAAHYQMLYYLLFFGVALVVALLIEAVQKKTLKTWLIATGILAVATGLAALKQMDVLSNTSHYAAFSIRGNSELSPETEAKLKGEDPKKTKSQKQTALDKDYAYGWSHGRLELISLLIPNAMGGSSKAAIKKDGEMYKNIPPDLDQNQNGIADNIDKVWPLYWGPQSFTAGPYYMGAIGVFLFLLGLILVRGPFKWAILYATLLLVILSLGKYSLSIPQTIVVLLLPIVFMVACKYVTKLPAPLLGVAVTLLGLLVLMSMAQGGYPDGAPTLADWFMENMPMYDKFRTPASALSVVVVFVPILGLMGVRELLSAERDKKERLQGLYVAAGVPLAICLLLAVMPDLISSTFKSAEEMTQKGNEQFYDLLARERKSALTSDAWRSLFFILVSALALWAWLTGKVKKASVALTVVAVLAVLDMFVVDMRYLWSEDYEPKSESTITPRPLDEALAEKLKKDYFRVLPVNRNDPFNFDGETPYTLNSIGGYSPIKMKRYQQLIEAYLRNAYVSLAQGKFAAANWNVLSMLNTKYIIHQAGIQDSVLKPGLPQPLEGEMAYINPMNYGPAWITPQVKVLPKPDDVLLALDTTDSRTLALLEQTDKPELGKFSADPVDSTEYVRVVGWSNNHMVYEFNSSKPRFVTFSEVYYPQWKAYLGQVGGEELKLYRVNFVLRGAIVPAGKHKVVMEIVNPLMHDSGMTNTLVSVLILLVLVAYLVFTFRKSATPHATAVQPEG